MFTSNMNSRKDHRPRWIGILVFALLLRGGVLLWTPDSLRADPDAYRAIAENLRDCGTFGHEHIPTAYRPPLYPILLLPCVACEAWTRVAIGLVHLVLGVATIYLTYWIGQFWELPGHGSGWKSAPLLAAVLVAVDPILLRQSSLVMTETLATFLAAATLAALAWAHKKPSLITALAAGGVAGMAVLCRPTFLPWVACVGLVFIFAERSRHLPARIALCASFVSGAGLILAAWVDRNITQFGCPIVTTTHGGYTLLLANNPSFYKYLRSDPWGSVWEGNEVNRWWANEVPHATAEDELRADRLAYTRAKQAIQQEPGMFCWSCLVRIGRLWQPLPHQVGLQEGYVGRSLRYTIGLWYLVELTLALFGILCLGRICFRSNVSWAILLALCFTMVHALYWTDMRMRAPLMPVVALAAATGVVWVTTWPRKTPSA
jgi:4-amino-4-deoxy-L-arabinose transferase-like glycosyltransferase